MAKDRAELTTYEYRRIRERILATSDICILCGHGGADAIDHVIPVARGGARMDPDNMAPIHGNDGCSVCLKKCNNLKGGKLLAEVLPVVTSRDWYAGP